MLTANAVLFLPFPWSPREGEWGREKAFQGPHLALMNISCFWLPLEEQNLFIFDALGACLVAECCFISALPPCFSSRLPSPSSFLFSGNISFFQRLLQKRSLSLSYSLLAVSQRGFCSADGKGQMGKGSSGEGGQETRARTLRSGAEAERRCRHSKRKVEGQRRWQKVGRRQQQDFAEEPAFQHLPEVVMQDALVLLWMGACLVKAPWKRGVPVLQGRMLLKLH